MGPEMSLKRQKPPKPKQGNKKIIDHNNWYHTKNIFWSQLSGLLNWIKSLQSNEANRIAITSLEYQRFYWKLKNLREIPIDNSFNFLYCKSMLITYLWMHMYVWFILFIVNVLYLPSDFKILLQLQLHSCSEQDTLVGSSKPALSYSEAVNFTFLTTYYYGKQFHFKSSLGFSTCLRNFNAVPGPGKLFTCSCIYCSANLAVKCIADLNL